MLQRVRAQNTWASARSDLATRCYEYSEIRRSCHSFDFGFHCEIRNLRLHRHTFHSWQDFSQRLRRTCYGSQSFAPNGQLPSPKLIPNIPTYGTSSARQHCHERNHETQRRTGETLYCRRTIMTYNCHSMSRCMQRLRLGHLRMLPVTHRDVCEHSHPYESPRSEEMHGTKSGPPQQLVPPAFSCRRLAYFRTHFFLFFLPNAAYLHDFACQFCG